MDYETLPKFYNARAGMYAIIDGYPLPLLIESVSIDVYGKPFMSVSEIPIDGMLAGHSFDMDGNQRATNNPRYRITSIHKIDRNFVRGVEWLYARLDKVLNEAEKNGIKLRSKSK